MLELFTISSKTLCFILSADPTSLNAIQGAIRRALEDGNSPGELEAMRQKACLSEHVGTYSVSSDGRARRM